MTFDLDELGKMTLEKALDDFLNKGMQRGLDAKKRGDLAALDEIIAELNSLEPLYAHLAGLADNEVELTTREHFMVGEWYAFD
jgi:hypothetical protein